MQQRLIELQLERGRLLERIAHQRAALARHAQPVTHVLQLGDRAAAAATQARNFASAHPLALALGVGVLIALRPGAALRWARRGFILWRSWGAARTVMARYVTPLL